MSKPTRKPDNPCFSSGPTAKRPGWSAANLDTSSLGRSHRAKGPKARLKRLIDQSKSVLGIPDDYLVGIVPASDTGAFEMAMWTLLGARGIDILAWESFGEGWLSDIRNQLKLEDVRAFEADYGSLPDLGAVDFSRDVIFTWNGTTSGVCVPNGDWIDANREGLTLCDATSALYAMHVDWDKLDVVTWSWQKALGGEAAHGMLALSPRAVARLESWKPSWPLPKIFRLTKGGKIMADVFEGSTINTPSMLAVEDHLDALAWSEGLGGLPALIDRSRANLAAIEQWVAQTPWIDFLAQDKAQRSSTSICLSIVDDWFNARSGDEQAAIIKKLVALLDAERVAFDIGSYRDAPPGLRIWGGGTVETADIEALLPWLDWGYAEVKAAS
ncbi:MAG TPA: phosphoserine transaminase [Pseudomonadales bacterium]|nr:phosphoserine transaminase [Pseudomonadales bacterium]